MDAGDPCVFPEQFHLVVFRVAIRCPFVDQIGHVEMLTTELSAMSMIVFLLRTVLMGMGLASVVQVGQAQLPTVAGVEISPRFH